VALEFTGLEPRPFGGNLKGATSCRVAQSTDVVSRFRGSVGIRTVNCPEIRKH
jgi:hypothetical protein